MSAKSEFYLTTRETAYILNVSPTTVRGYIYQGTLDAWTKDNSPRILIKFRDLIAMTREYNKSYHAYRASMLASGWCEVSKERSHSVESGTVLLVNVQPRVYEHWHTPIEHAEISQTVTDHWSYRRISIVPMGGQLELEEIQEAAEKATS